MDFFVDNEGIEQVEADRRDVRLDRGELVWINVSRNPIAAWVARQITEAFPYEELRAT
jgi:hypothetical protein